MELDQITDVVETEEVDVQPEVETGDTAPEQEEEVKQSISAQEKINHAIEKLRKQGNLTKQELAEKEQSLKELDSMYARLAATQGRPDIQNAKQYFEALEIQNMGFTPEQAMYMKQKEQPLSNPQVVQETATTIVNQSEAEQVKEFNELFGYDLNSFGDVVKVENADGVISSMLNKHKSLTEAYLDANRGTAQKRIGQKAKQQVLNTARGRDHVKQDNKPAETKEIKIDKAEFAYFRAFNDTLSDKDAKAAYIKQQKALYNK